MAEWDSYIYITAFVILLEHEIPPGESIDLSFKDLAENVHRTASIEYQYL